MSSKNVGALHEVASYPLPSATPAVIDTTTDSEEQPPVTYPATVFVPVSSSSLPGHPPALVALDATTDTPRWITALPGAPAGVAATEGLAVSYVYVTFPTSQGVAFLEALNITDGHLAWADELPGAWPSAPTLSQDLGGFEAISVTLFDTHKVFTTTTTAGQLPHIATSTGYSTPVAAGDGNVYVGDNTGRLTALDEEFLTTVWTVAATSPSPLEGTPIVSGTSVYAISRDGHIATFKVGTGAAVATGRILGTVTDPAAVDTNTLYVTSTGGGDTFLWALDSTTLAVKWVHTPLTAGVGSGPTVANGIVYYSTGSTTEAVRTADGSLIASIPAGGSHLQPIVTGGRLYISANVLSVYTP